MSFAVTRAYMRGRLLFIMTGFLLAVCLGAVLVHLQTGAARTNVQFGAVLSAMSETTADVIYSALNLDHARLGTELAEEGERTAAHARGAGPALPRQTPAGQSVADAEARREQALASLHRATERLENAYRSFETIVAGEFVPGNTGDRQASAAKADAPRGALQTIFEDVAGAEIPAALTRIWYGEDGSFPLRRDVLEVITLANRLDIITDHSLPAAQRVFAKLQELAATRVRPNLEAIGTELRGNAIESYDSLRLVLGPVALAIAMVGFATAVWVFVPMMRNIAAAHDDLRAANASMEAARARAESADRAKSEFLANMSHEIRTPMNGVLGMAELLARTDLDDRQKTFADVILKSGNALLTIINDILDFSKINAGQLSLDPAPFRLGEAIEDVAMLVSTRVAEKDLELIVRIAPDLPPWVVGDVGRLRQIVTNLVGNGVKFTEKGHVLIDVSAEIRDGVARVTVRVEDTGIGIPETMLDSVFEKFSQVDASSTRRHEGTGLGLAIASRLVELMGGKIGVTSEPGKGSTFWFGVPLAVYEDAEPEQPVPVDVGGARVLVIDDHAVNRDILLEQLRSWGFDCAAAEDGMIGLAFLERAAELRVNVDCVILDYQMPGMNGAEVARRIAANPVLRHIPVLLLTSVDQAVTGRLALESGIAAHLNKPARSSVLLETLVSVMQAARNAPKDATVRRPLPPAPRPAPQPTAPIAWKEPKSRLDILVAEDNEVNQLVFSQILDGLGFSYRIVANGRTAVELHRTLKPRLILMDVSMPEMNGLQATAAIRSAEEKSGTRTPIVGVTAHALKDDREKCILAGMDDYLPKPVSPNRLATKIEAWIGKEEEALRA